MILSGHQPEYLPYPGFFYKMLKADKFILVDHVQFEKKNFQNRNKIQIRDGSIWLTVPVITKGKRFQKINEVEINNELPWAENHWKAIMLSYKNTPFFEEHADFFEQLYKKKWVKLVDLNLEIIKYIAEQLEIKKELLLSSDFDFKKNKDELLVEMCQKTNSDTYLSGKGGKAYVSEGLFEENKLNHIFSDFELKEYRQRFKPFAPNMSIIDLLFNHGKKEARKMLLEFHE